MARCEAIGFRLTSAAAQAACSCVLAAEVAALASSGSEQLNRLRGHGIKLALDDFGTGFSSLSYLRSLPLDVLKIAKEFTDGIAHDDEDATFVRLIVELAAMRGLTVIAEGVETPAQLDVLRRLNCHLGQGYHFARPLDPDDPFFRARAVAQSR